MSGKKIGLLALVMMGCAAGGDPGVAIEAHGAEPPYEPPKEAVGCWVTGGGQVEAENGAFVGGAFGFNAMSMRNGTFRGRLNHVTFDGDHFRGRTVDFIECFVVEGEEPDPPDADPVIARWTGEGIFNDNRNCDYIVEVEDHGEPGRDDRYHLMVFCVGDAGRRLVYEVDNVIARGNIQIHPPNPGHPDLSSSSSGRRGI